VGMAVGVPGIAALRGGGDEGATAAPPARDGPAESGEASGAGGGDREARELPHAPALCRVPDYAEWPRERPDEAGNHRLGTRHNPDGSSD
ncbi:MAG: hypothetical protein UW76_C0028G0001, partial [Parcubacteria group bacterium GW2011_GWF2_44_8b]